LGCFIDAKFFIKKFGGFKYYYYLCHRIKKIRNMKHFKPIEERACYKVFFEAEYVGIHIARAFARGNKALYNKWSQWIAKTPRLTDKQRKLYWAIAFGHLKAVGWKSKSELIQISDN